MQNLENKIRESVAKFSGQGELAQIIDYAMFPAGKLFRPKLVMAIALDLNEISEDHYLLASAVEAHHAYSLVHDDLPCMDDDDIRRGKASTHKKYGEWKALLAGDALINLSFELLANMESQASKEIIADFSKMMGSRGLILGQFIDLSHENKSFEDTLLMHELKTARLIQFSLAASLALSSSAKAVEVPREEILEAGKIIGINFQLLDDLGELLDTTDSHEEEVNAFLNYKASDVLDLILSNNQKILSITKERNLENLEKMYREFLAKTSAKIKPGMDLVCSRTGLAEKDFETLLNF